MKVLPLNLVMHKKTPLFTAENMPDGLKRSHQTKPGVWGVIKVVSGSLKYKIENGKVYDLTPDNPGVIEPQVKHSVELQGNDASFFVEFYGEPGIITGK